jgi:reductive dehalogenase
MATRPRERRRRPIPSRNPEPLGIVGPVERVDERDTVISKAVKGRLGATLKKRMREPVPDALWRTVYPRQRKENSIMWHLYEAVDGPLNPEVTPAPDPVANAERIKEVARFLGADLVGISELRSEFVYTHYGNMFESVKGTLGDPVVLDHAYAISLARRMDRKKLNVSPSYIEGSETALRYSELALISCMLAAYIRELGYPARAHHLGREAVLHQPLAVQAGLGEVGRNDMVISKKFGPGMRLATVTTDLPLAVDRPVSLGVREFCEICGKCADNCPSQSITKGPPTVARGILKWQLRAERCLSFWNSNPQFFSSCANCLKVCPYNKPWKWWHRVSLGAAKHSRLGRLALLVIDDLVYGRYPQYKGEALGYTYPVPPGTPPRGASTAVALTRKPGRNRGPGHANGEPGPANANGHRNGNDNGAATRGYPGPGAATGLGDKGRRP